MSVTFVKIFLYGAKLPSIEHVLQNIHQIPVLMIVLDDACYTKQPWIVLDEIV